MFASRLLLPLYAVSDSPWLARPEECVIPTTARRSESAGPPRPSAASKGQH
jgi:hypothetical protein